MRPAVTYKFQPSRFAHRSAGFRQTVSHQIEPLAQEGACLKFQIGRNQLEKRSLIFLAQFYLPHEGRSVRGKAVAQAAVVQHAAERGDEINGGQGCAPV